MKQTLRIGLLLLLSAQLVACRTEIPGVGCTSDPDCTGGGSCVNSVCVEKPAAGDCASGASCTDGLACVEGRCALPPVCEPACGAYEDCSADTTCVASFETLAIASPAPGASVGLEVEVSAVLTRRQFGAAAPPATLVLEAAPTAGETETTTLALVPGTVTYQGQWRPALGGGYALKAVSPELALTSAPVAVQVTACPVACSPNLACVLGICTEPFPSLTITSPDAGAVVGGKLKVTAVLARTPGTEQVDPPEKLTLHDTHSTSDQKLAVDMVALTKNGLEFGAELTLLKAGEHQLRAEGAGATSATVKVTVDLTPPVLLVRVAPATARKTAAPLNEEDTTAAYKSAHRRDEVATVYVESDDEDLVVDSVKLTVKGTGAGAKEFALKTATNCLGQASPRFCREAEIKLWDPALALDGFHGEFQVQVTGQDQVGNEGSGNTKILVTRWKWAFSAGGGPITAAPALGIGGDVYFVTANALTGKVGAVSPAGDERWSHTLGSASSVAVAVVGGSGSERDQVFVAGRSGVTAAVWSFDHAGAMTQQKPICDGGLLALVDGASEAAIAVLNTKTALDTAPVPTAVAFFNGLASELVAVRPGSPRPCITKAVTASTNKDSGFAVSGQDAYLTDVSGKLNSLRFDGATREWALNPGSPFALTTTGTNPVVVADEILGGGQDNGRFFALPRTGGALRTADTAKALWNTSVSTDGLIAGSNDNTLYFASKVPVVTRQVDIGGVAKGAPAIGSDRTMYVATTASDFIALAADGSKRWSAKLGAASESSVTLDCSRDASGKSDKTRPGVAYVGAGDGKLYAFIVESQGLDITAPWPKFHRDPQNSANADVDLAKVVCR